MIAASKSDVKSQLALALAWNRCDIARQEIFTPENRHKWEVIKNIDQTILSVAACHYDFIYSVRKFRSV